MPRAGQRRGRNSRDLPDIGVMPTHQILSVIQIQIQCSSTHRTFPSGSHLTVFLCLIVVLPREIDFLWTTNPSPPSPQILPIRQVLRLADDSALTSPHLNHLIPLLHLIVPLNPSLLIFTKGHVSRPRPNRVWLSVYTVAPAWVQRVRLPPFRRFLPHIGSVGWNCVDLADCRVGYWFCDCTDRGNWPRSVADIIGNCIAGFRRGVSGRHGIRRGAIHG